MTREELDELRRSRLALLRENLASGKWTVSGGDGTDDSDEDEDEDDLEDEEQDLDDEEDDDGADDDDKSKGKKGGDDAAKSKGRKAGGFKAPTSQDELDRIVERRLARERAKIVADASTKTRDEIKSEQDAERERRKGNFDPILKRREKKIAALEDDVKEIEFYRDMFKDTLAKETKGLPKGVLEKLMPKGLTPAAQLQWVRDYREHAGLDDDADDEEDEDTDEDDDEADTDEAKRKAARKRKADAAKKDKTAEGRDQRRGSSRRPNPDTRVPKPEDLVKAQRAKRGAPTF